MRSSEAESVPHRVAAVSACRELLRERVAKRLEERLAAGMIEEVQDLMEAIGQLLKRQNTYFRGMERRGTPMHWLDDNDHAAAIELVEEALVE